VIILWLVVFGLAAGFIPLYLLASGIRSDVTRRSGDLQLVQKSLTAVPTLPPTVQKLVDDLAQVEAPAQGIQNAYATVVAGRTDWQAILAAIRDYDPTQLSITSLAYANNQITLNGRAVNDAAVTDYARALERPHLFAQVVIQSIKVMGTPTTAMTGTVVGPGATPTAIVSMTSTLAPLGDAYEVDDFVPKDIVFGQPQSHTFYPPYDVDKVKFLAKSGRFYRVYTFDLIPGVDTFLSVSVGGTTLTNDDRQPGDLGSEVIFEAPVGSDTQAIVTATNRGQYGPDKAYSIAIEEIVPTPTSTSTPVATSTSTATPTSTPSPIATSTSTATPTFTPTPPDLRDKYEPDDVDPGSIAIGETQRHNFYPNGDIDKAQFLAKAGRVYRVTTSDLTIGVDTALKVQVGGAAYTNDDRQPGDLSSEVVFLVPAGSDVQAIVTVTNRGQYGSDKSYNVAVEEIIPTPTFTPSPTATDTATATATPSPPPPTATPTNTLTPTSTAEARPMGSVPDEGVYPLAITSLRLIPGLALPVLSYPAQAVEHPIPRLLEAGIGERQPSGDAQTVEFVIVLELKR
jgi:hypothetical protein